MIKYIGNPIEKYRGRILRVLNQKVELPNGKKMFFEYVERSPGVRIMVTSNNKYLLNKEWRVELNNWDYRLPGGKVFDTLEEFIETQRNSNYNIEQECVKAAQRELYEETGLKIDISFFSKSCVSKLGATVMWDLHYYFVNKRNLVFDEREIQTHEGEHIHCVWLTKDEVLNLFLTNKIKEDRSISFILRNIL